MPKSYLVVLIIISVFSKATQSCNINLSEKECTPNACPEHFFDGFNCRRCITANQFQCDLCKSYSFCHSNNKCQKDHHKETKPEKNILQFRFLTTVTNCNIQNCINCTTLAGSIICLGCNTNYTVVANGCQNCGSLFSNCLTCNSDICLTCIQGYFQQDDNTCAICSLPNCLQCIPINGKNTCQTCNNNFTVVNGSCSSCSFLIPNCLACANSNTCYTCISNYYVQANGSCLGCTLTNCQTCAPENGQSTCILCVDGYRVVNAICQSCTLLVSRCATCTKTICLSCLANYTLSNITGLCDCHLPNCANCSIISNIDTCVQCDISYALSSNICQPCNTIVSSCLYCSNLQTCIQCIGNFTLSNNTCICTQNNCQQCQIINQISTCLKCVLGFTPMNSTCISCGILIPYCLICNQSNCLKCQTNFVNQSDGTCACFINNCTLCVVVNGNSVCRACFSGFTVVGNICQLCSLVIPYCTSCLNSTFCTICNVGYILVNGSCSICNLTDCATCINLSGNLTCSQCINTGFDLVAGVCTNCSLLIPRCSNCSNHNCSACQAGYLLNYDGTCGCVVTNCSVCVISGASNLCRACLTSYAFSGSQCILCSDLLLYCVNCSSKSTCNQCIANYTLQPNGSCYKCQGTIPECLNCLWTTNGDLCLTCNTSYTTNGTWCLLCSNLVIQCLICDGSICLQCNPGYLLINGTCTCYLPGCLSCIIGTTSNTCALCANNYTLASGACKSCSVLVPNCFHCVGASCIQCIQNYTLLSNNTCQSCPIANCLQCTFLTNSTLCRQCNQTYALNTTFNGCLSCATLIPGCLTCTLNDCTSCQNNYTLLSDGTCGCILPGCLSCLIINSVNTCQTCNLGYALNGILCVSCPFGCLTCSTPIQCLTCFPSYTLNGNGSCLNCLLPFCASCSFLNGITVCFSCLTNYTLVNSGCLICSSLISNCLTCSNSYLCTTCQIGYALRSNGSCIKCGVNNCDSCQLIEGNFTCLECLNGWELVGQICLGCSDINPFCSKCNATFYCQSCEIGYGFDQKNNCVQCNISNCINCAFTSGLQICTNCQPGLYLDLGICYFCSDLIPNCLTCQQMNSSIICTNCESNYTIQTNGTCLLPCGRTTNTSTSCYCSIQMYQLNKTCFPCPLGCLTCSPLACLGCLPTYFLNLLVCNACSPYCLYCTSISNCLQCNVGYSLISNSCTYTGINKIFLVNNQFFICPSSCQICSINNSGQILCSMPAPSFSVDSSGVLYKCNDYCLTCNAGNYSACLKCSPGYFLNVTQCSPCPTSCNTCDQFICMDCFISYTLSNNGICLSCGENCISCDQYGSGMCDPGKCFDGFVNVIGSCVSCISGCICVQPTPTLCIACPQGAYLNGNSCLQCSSNCLSCNNSSCTTCASGFQLTGGSCYIIPPFPCLSYSLGICLSCFTGYQLLNGLCQPYSCSNCQSCPLGNYLLNSACNPCPVSKCNLCDPGNPSTCIQCSDGYYLSIDSNCNSCSLNCLSCLALQICLIAANGYYLGLLNGQSTGIVLECDPSCLTCSNQPQQCTSCPQGFTLNSTRCFSSIFSIVNLIVDPSQLIPGWDSMTTSQRNAAIPMNYQKIYNSFLQLLNLTNSPERVFLTSLSAGSLNSSLSVSAQQGQSSSNLNSQLQNSINTNSGASSLQVISSSITSSNSPAQNSNNNNSNNNNSNSSNSNSSGWDNSVVGIIVGVIIGVLGLIALVGIVIYQKKDANKEQNQQQPRIADSNKPIYPDKIDEPTGPTGQTRRRRHIRQKNKKKEEQISRSSSITTLPDPQIIM